MAGAFGNRFRASDRVMDGNPACLFFKAVGAYASLASFPDSQQHHAANDHDGAEDDSQSDALDIAQKERGENEREEEPGTADGDHHRDLAQIQRVIDTDHAETDDHADGEKPPKALPVHLPRLLAFLYIPKRQNRHDER